MKFIDTGIEDLWVIEPTVFEDDRGFFYEGFKSDVLAQKGFDVSFNQDNIAQSKKGVIRGMHLQKEPFAQAKILRCLTGAILDVAVDMRIDSPSYKKYFSIELTQDNHKQLLVPRGFAHGYLSLEDNTIISYKVDNYYNPKHENGISYRDKHLNIDWGIDLKNIITSEKDEVYPNYDW